jgi:GNAT superfamily N-acetyltransferase
MPGRAEVSVRPARAGDAEAIAQVQLVTWRTAYRALLPEAVLDEWDSSAAVAAWRAAVLSPPSPAHGVLVAVDGVEVTGFAAYGPPEGDSEPDGRTAEVTALLVEPRWGRRGHGSRLLAAVADLAAGTGVARLEMWLPEADAVTAGFLTGAGWAADGWARTLDTGGRPLRQQRWHALLDDLDPRGAP